ncbi:MAG: hypothetical protein AMXMBFR33_26190 [Candidatus Xenobia bacterium]
MLKPCRECETHVSTQATTCPRCGAPKPTQQSFRGWGYEWKSRQQVAGWPLIHIAFGRDADGRLRVARGIIAIGQFAVGLLTLAQFGVGLVFGLGQFTFGLVAVGQIAGGLAFGLGQFASGYVAVGQMVLAGYGLGQFGLGLHLWTVNQADPAALAFFRPWLPW